MSCCGPRIVKRRIHQLPAVDAALLADLLEIERIISGVYKNRKVSLQQIADLFLTVFATIGSNNIHGNGPPVGVVTPDAIDQFYRDVTTPGLWQATGLTNADWIPWVSGG